VIFRSPRPKENFTIVSNQVIRNTQLSWKARGLLIYLLSQPDHWRTSTARLAAMAPDGIHAVRSGMTELEQAGYIRRVKMQRPNGQWQTTTIVYDTPVEKVEDKWLTYPQPKSGNPTSENLTA
jgi:hypothetical protein